MAARINLQQDAATRQRKWPAYVYHLTDGASVVYVGKGTGQRLAKQRRAFGLDGHEVARFRSEKAAYRFEREQISELMPPMNRHSGGNGSYSKPRVVRLAAWERDMLAIGLKRYSAQILMKYPYMLAPSKVDEIRRIANEG